MKNTLVLLSTALVLSAAGQAQAQVTTADSPAFNKSYSIDFSAGYRGSFEKTRQVPKVSKSPCGCFTKTTFVNEKYYDTPYINYGIKANFKLDKNSIFSAGVNNSAYFAETVYKSGSIATAVGLDFKANKATKRASLALSPVKNLAVYTAYNLDQFSYGIQWQTTKDISLTVNYLPNLATYNFAVTANVGPSAPSQVVATPPEAVVPQVVPVVKPQTIPVPPVRLNYPRARG